MKPAIETCFKTLFTDHKMDPDQLAVAMRVVQAMSDCYDIDPNAELERKDVEGALEGIPEGAIERVMFITSSPNFPATTKRFVAGNGTLLDTKDIVKRIHDASASKEAWDKWDAFKASVGGIRLAYKRNAAFWDRPSV